ncbi:MAG: SRPBCC domain-containing protein [Bacteroidales bacterium]|nr:SRPBCC domain-containing protein [Bacteroidales bacterium]
MNQISKPIVVEQEFNSSVGKVWNAITKLEEMKQWFFDNIPAFEPVVGFETEFSVQSEGRNFQHLWRILEVEPNKKIKYYWRYKEHKGEGFVTFELFESKENTKLRVTNEGLDSFPQDIPEFKRESCQAGWEFFIKERLKTYLDR